MDKINLFIDSKWFIILKNQLNFFKKLFDSNTCLIKFDETIKLPKDPYYYYYKQTY